MTKDVFCRDKHMFVAKKTLLSRKTRRVAAVCASRNRQKDWWNRNKTFRIRNGARSLMTRAVRGNTMSKSHSFECFFQTRVIVCCTSEHSTTWWSDGKPVRKGAGLTAQSGTLYSTCQLRTTW